MLPYNFQAPFFCKIVGPPYSGKRKVIEKFLQQPCLNIEPQVKRIIYCHIGPRPFYIDNVEFFRGIPNLEHIKNSLLIFDDLEDFCVESSAIQDLFLNNSFGNSVIFLSHQFSYPGQYEDLINQKIDYLFQTRNHIGVDELKKIGYQLIEDLYFSSNDDKD